MRQYGDAEEHATHSDTITQAYRASTPTPQIATDINTATRTLHTTLNRLIITHLPRATPPHATTPAAYTIGLKAFAAIFFTFEAAWDACSKSKYGNEELYSAIAALLPPELRRTKALRKDLSYLTNLAQRQQVQGRRKSTDEEVADTHDTISDLLSRDNHDLNSPITQFISHISTTIHTKPHLIIAYTWVMYMALFSGGRYIRAHLRAAGPVFWGRVGSAHITNTTTNHIANSVNSAVNKETQGNTEEESGFSFLNFGGERDGEDIKSAFKIQLACVDKLLSVQQRREIVDEAKGIFERCLGIVGELESLAKHGQKNQLSLVPRKEMHESSDVPHFKLDSSATDSHKYSSWAQALQLLANNFIFFVLALGIAAFLLSSSGERSSTLATDW